MLGVILFFLILSLPQTVSAKEQIVTFEPVETAIVDSFYPEKRDLNPEKLNVGFTNTHALSFLRYDLSSLATDTKILSATLSAFVTDGWGDEIVPIEIYPPLEAWCGGKLSWNTKPSLLKAATSAAVAKEAGWVYWDVSEIVSSWIQNSTDNNGLVLGSDRGSYQRRFEGIKSKNKPVLRVAVDSDIELNSKLVATGYEATQVGYIDKSCQREENSVLSKTDVISNQNWFFPQIIKQFAIPLTFGALGIAAILFHFGIRRRPRE